MGCNRRKYGYQFYEEWRGGEVVNYVETAASSSAVAAEPTPEEIASWWDDHNIPENWYQEWVWCYYEQEWCYTWWKYNKKYDGWREYDPKDTPRMRHAKPAKKSGTPSLKIKWRKSLRSRKLQTWI